MSDRGLQEERGFVLLTAVSPVPRMCLGHSGSSRNICRVHGQRNELVRLQVNLFCADLG